MDDEELRERALQAEEAIKMIDAFEAIEGTICGHSGCTDHPEVQKRVRVVGSFTAAQWDFKTICHALRSATSIRLVLISDLTAVEFIHNDHAWRVFTKESRGSHEGNEVARGSDDAQHLRRERESPRRSRSSVGANADHCME